MCINDFYQQYLKISVSKLLALANTTKQPLIAITTYFLNVPVLINSLTLS